jgi:uncharacterized protein (TIGR03435 family)
MKKIITLLLVLSVFSAKSQDYILKAGDHFPDITLHPMVNAPLKELYLNNYPSKKIFILNFWGTWCSPCISEMYSLAKLQARFQQQIQVIGYANDAVEKLNKYNAKKPSQIWLASDTSFLLYQMFNLAYVGQSAIIDANRNIVAIVKTDSVNAKLITRLLKGEKIKSNAVIKEVSHTDKDAFGIDSLQASSFTIRSYMKGQQTMGRTYSVGPFADRRITFYNITPTTMYKDAYGIVSQKQVIYELDKKKYEDYSDKNQLYCFDLMVKPEDKDSLKVMMQRKLNEGLPVKARTEMRTMPVYILKQKTGTVLNLIVSSTAKLDYSFSGNGFDGKGITVAEFSDIYLNNELDLPVVDETGLTARYDIKTTNELRDKANIFNAVDKLGLALKKAERPVKVMILYTK